MAIAHEWTAIPAVYEKVVNKVFSGGYEKKMS